MMKNACVMNNKSVFATFPASTNHFDVMLLVFRQHLSDCR